MSHCADAVLSFANKTTIVGDIAPTLLSLISNWVETCSDYETLMAKSVSSTWANNHLPVLSGRGHDPSRYSKFSKDGQEVANDTSDGDDHILYTRFNLGQPRGKTIKCHGGCDKGITSKQTKGGVRVECKGCKSRSMVPAFKTSTTTLLGKRGLVAVAYPQDQYPTPNWKLSQAGPPNPTPPTPAPPESTPAPPESTPAPLESTPPPKRPTPHLPLQSTLPPPLPDLIVRSTSLPPRTSARPTTPESSTPLTIRIPRRPSDRGASTTNPSRKAGTHSATTTPPEPATATPPEPRKRQLSELIDQLWGKKQKREDGHDNSPNPPTH